MKLEQLEHLHSEIPTTTPWLLILVIHTRPQVKTTQSQNHKFQNISKNSNFKILQEFLHPTHFLKLLDKMYKYEMDPTRTVDATEQTWDAGRMDRQTDGQTDGVKQIYPQQLRCVYYKVKTEIKNKLISDHFVYIVFKDYIVFKIKSYRIALSKSGPTCRGQRLILYLICKKQLDSTWRKVSEICLCHPLDIYSNTFSK